MNSSDVDVILKWENNKSNWKVSDTKTPFTKEDIETFVNSIQDINYSKQIRFIICLKTSNKAIGCIDLFEFDANKKRAGVGILIGEKAYRKKGFAKEALSILKTYCQGKIGLKQLFCNISLNNTTSIRLFEKKGFKFVEAREVFEQKVNYYECLLS
jgi:diamine N-acetyltransferase